MKHVTTEEPKPFWDNDNTSWGMSSPTLYKRGNSGISTLDNFKCPNNASDYRVKNEYIKSEYDFSTASILYSQDSTSSTCNVRPTQFTMWVGASDYVGGSHERIHTYSQLSLDTPILPKMVLSGIQDWEARFPCLLNVLQSGKAATVIHLESSISVMSLSSLDTVILGTNFEVNYTDTVIHPQWECTTRIYAQGKKVWEMTQNVQHSEQFDGTTKLALPFASEFWAALYINHSQSQSASSSAIAQSRMARDKDNEISAAISGLTVVQELANIPSMVYGDRQLTAIFLWEFTRADPGEQGVAQWREIVTPPLQLPHNNTNDVLNQMLAQQKRQQQYSHLSLSLSSSNSSQPSTQAMFLPSPLGTPTDGISGVTHTHSGPAEDLLQWTNVTMNSQFAFDPQFGIGATMSSYESILSTTSSSTSGLTTTSETLADPTPQFASQETLSPGNYFTEVCTPASSGSSLCSEPSSCALSAITIASSASNPISAKSVNAVDNGSCQQYTFENQSHQHHPPTQGYDANGSSISIPCACDECGGQVDDGTGNCSMDFFGVGATAGGGVWMGGFSELEGVNGIE